MKYFWIVQMWIEFAFTNNPDIPIVIKILISPITIFLLAGVIILNIFTGWMFSDVKDAWKSR